LSIARIAPSAAPRVVRVVLTHHPFDLPEGQGEEHLIGRSQMAMAQLATIGADLFLAGHLHVSHVGRTAERYKIAGHSALVVQAGCASPKPHRRRESEESRAQRGGRNAWAMSSEDSQAIGTLSSSWK
jgi:3',5'-cyclic AMP phosphodiesterase CpdA